MLHDLTKLLHNLIHIFWISWHIFLLLFPAVVKRIPLRALNCLIAYHISIYWYRSSEFQSNRTEWINEQTDKPPTTTTEEKKMIYMEVNWISHAPASALCHAKLAHNRANVLPDPVGLSSKQCWPRCNPRITCININQTSIKFLFKDYIIT